MYINELKEYVRRSFISGVSVEDIEQKLFSSGWQKSDIQNIFQELGILSRQSPSSSKKTLVIFSYLVLIGAVIVLSGATLYLYQNRIDLSNTNEQKVRDFYINLTQS